MPVRKNNFASLAAQWRIATIRAGACLLLLAGLGGFGNSALGRTPDGAFGMCRNFYGLLSKSKKIEAALAKKPFEYLGATHRGCEVRFAFDTADSDEVGIERMFYPFPGSPLAQDGWRAERQADGPGASAFDIRRGNVFCHIEWAFPSYLDDARQEYVIGKRTTGHVRCASGP